MAGRTSVAFAVVRCVGLYAEVAGLVFVIAKAKNIYYPIIELNGWLRLHNGENLGFFKIELDFTPFGLEFCFAITRFCILAE